MKRHYTVESAEGWLYISDTVTDPKQVTEPEFGNEEVVETVRMMEDDLRQSRLDPRVIVLRVDQPTEAEIDARFLAPIPSQPR